METRLIDSYSESNYSDDISILSVYALGQCFATNIEAKLSSCKFYLKKSGSPTGSIYAKLYTLTGTYGTNAKPTGLALATSGSFESSLLTTSYDLITFNFSGVNKIDLSANTKYGISIEGNFDSPNYIKVGGDDTTLGHSGNYFSKVTPSIWAGSDNKDICFYVYGEINSGNMLGLLF